MNKGPTSSPTREREGEGTRRGETGRGGVMVAGCSWLGFCVPPMDTHADAKLITTRGYLDRPDHTDVVAEREALLPCLSPPSAAPTDSGKSSNTVTGGMNLYAGEHWDLQLPASYSEQIMGTQHDSSALEGQLRAMSSGKIFLSPFLYVLP